MDTPSAAWGQTGSSSQGPGPPHAAPPGAGGRNVARQGDEGPDRAEERVAKRARLNPGAAGSVAPVLGPARALSGKAATGAGHGAGAAGAGASGAGAAPSQEDVGGAALLDADLDPDLHSHARLRSVLQLRQYPHTGAEAGGAVLKHVAAGSAVSPGGGSATAAGEDSDVSEESVDASLASLDPGPLGPGRPGLSRASAGGGGGSARGSGDKGSARAPPGGHMGEQASSSDESDVAPAHGSAVGTSGGHVEGRNAGDAGGWDEDRLPGGQEDGVEAPTAALRGPHAAAAAAGAAAAAAAPAAPHPTDHPAPRRRPGRMGFTGAVFSQLTGSACRMEEAVRHIFGTPPEEGTTRDVKVYGRQADGSLTAPYIAQLGGDWQLSGLAALGNTLGARTGDWLRMTWEMVEGEGGGAAGGLFGLVLQKVGPGAPQNAATAGPRADAAAAPVPRQAGAGAVGSGQGGAGGSGQPATAHRERQQQRQEVREEAVRRGVPETASSSVLLQQLRQPRPEAGTEPQERGSLPPQPLRPQGQQQQQQPRQGQGQGQPPPQGQELQQRQGQGRQQRKQTEDDREVIQADPPSDPAGPTAPVIRWPRKITRGYVMSVKTQIVECLLSKTQLQSAKENIQQAMALPADERSRVLKRYKVTLLARYRGAEERIVDVMLQAYVNDIGDSGRTTTGWRVNHLAELCEHLQLPVPAKVKPAAVQLVRAVRQDNKVVLVVEPGEGQEEIEGEGPAAGPVAGRAGQEPEGVGAEGQAEGQEAAKQLDGGGMLRGRRRAGAEALRRIRRGLGGGSGDSDGDETSSDGSEDETGDEEGNERDDFGGSGSDGGAGSRGRRRAGFGVRARRQRWGRDGDGDGDEDSDSDSGEEPIRAPDDGGAGGGDGGPEGQRRALPGGAGGTAAQVVSRKRPAASPARLQRLRAAPGGRGGAAGGLSGGGGAGGDGGGAGGGGAAGPVLRGAPGQQRGGADPGANGGVPRAEPPVMPTDGGPGAAMPVPPCNRILRSGQILLTAELVPWFLQAKDILVGKRAASQQQLQVPQQQHDGLGVEDGGVQPGGASAQRGTAVHVVKLFVGRKGFSVKLTQKATKSAVLSCPREVQVELKMVQAPKDGIEVQLVHRVGQGGKVEVEVRLMEQQQQQQGGAGASAAEADAGGAAQGQGGAGPSAGPGQHRHEGLGAGEAHALPEGLPLAAAADGQAPSPVVGGSAAAAGREEGGGLATVTAAAGGGQAPRPRMVLPPGAAGGQGQAEGPADLAAAVGQGHRAELPAGTARGGTTTGGLAPSLGQAGTAAAEGQLQRVGVEAAGGQVRGPQPPPRPAMSAPAYMRPSAPRLRELEKGELQGGHRVLALDRQERQSAEDAGRLHAVGQPAGPGRSGAGVGQAAASGAADAVLQPCAAAGEEQGRGNVLGDGAGTSDAVQPPTGGGQVAGAPAGAAFQAPSDEFPASSMAPATLRGYIASDEQLPPVREGELRRCGLTWPPSLAPEVRAAMDAWLQVLGPGGRRPVAAGVPGRPAQAGTGGTSPVGREVPTRSGCPGRGQCHCRAVRL